MNEPSDDLRDDELGARLASALGELPRTLTSQLVRLTAAGLHAPGAEGRAAWSWRAAGPRFASGALLLAFVVAALPRLFALVTGPSALGAHLSSAPLPPAAAGALSALTIPLGVVLWLEAMRGAATVRSWLR